MYHLDVVKDEIPLNCKDGGHKKMSMYYPPKRSDELYHHGVKGMHWGVRKQTRQIRKLYRKNIRDQRKLDRLQRYKRRRKEHLIDPVGLALDIREDALKDRIEERFSAARELSISAASKYAEAGEKRYKAMAEKIERRKLEKEYRKLTR